MRKIYLVLAIVFAGITLNAQITLSSGANTPQIGDTFHYVGEQQPNIDIRAGGPNQTWDFSSISGYKDTARYIPLSESAAPNEFPNSDIVEVGRDGESYYSKDVSHLSIEGNFIPGQGSVKYHNKRELLSFPMTYGDSLTETFSATVKNFVSGQSFQRGGDLEIKADGYGTLILPYKTLNNVLRVRQVAHYADTVNGMPFFNYADTIYLWYNANTSTYVATYNVIYANGSFANSGALYLDESDLVTSVQEIKPGKRSLSFYPNPATDVLFIKNPGEAATIRLFDISGKLIDTKRIAPGQSQMNIAGLRKGVYLVTGKMSGQTFSEKLIIE